MSKKDAATLRQEIEALRAKADELARERETLLHQAAQDMEGLEGSTLGVFKIAEDWCAIYLDKRKVYDHHLDDRADTTVAWWCGRLGVRDCPMIVAAPANEFRGGDLPGGWTAVVNMARERGWGVQGYGLDVCEMPQDARQIAPAGWVV